MGPEAGLSLYHSIFSHTKAKKDQDHLSVILMSFSKHIADRTAFLEGEVLINPAYAIVEVIGKLETAGARIVGLACNTTHSPEIFDVIREQLDKRDSQVRLLNMPEETCRSIRENHGAVRRVGIMATNGTWRAGLYQDLLEKYGYEAVVPDPGFQERVIHRMIYDPGFGIKANPLAIRKEVTQLLEQALRYFKERDTDAIILGCTELPLALKSKVAHGMLIIDSTASLAASLVRAATQPRKHLL
jgi:aspartate racemase